jgi:hypothetical protein
LEQSDECGSFQPRKLICEIPVSGRMLTGIFLWPSQLENERENLVSRETLPSFPRIIGRIKSLPSRNNHEGL